MARRCQLTGKTPARGKTYSKRGIAKKKKGIGLNITGSSKRRFKPNLVVRRFWFEEEKRYIKLRLSANAIRTINKNGLAAAVKEMRKNGEKV